MKRRSKKVLVAVVGGVVLLIGIITIPYPGPGWLIVFAGLGILSTEFEWAKRVLTYARSKYDAWQKWVAGQPTYVKIGIWAATAIIVVLTIWALNGYGLINEWFKL